MAADVSTGLGADGKNMKKEPLVTRDLLGGAGGGGSSSHEDERELWEKKLQLLSRNSSFSHRAGTGPVTRELHDLNLPPPPSPETSFASVCTLEKVKSALDRAMGNPGPNPNWSPGSDGSASSTAKRPASDEEMMDGQVGLGCGYRTGSMTLTVCPGCFQYLLISAVDPWCPSCEAHVPIPKKLNIDLNCSTN